jgi:hypothetical protein
VKTLLCSRIKVCLEGRVIVLLFYGGVYELDQNN